MGCRVRGMTTQEYRRSYDYRSEYFKHNPGIFNYIWFCSQCHAPLFGKQNVVVDHIRPLNKGGRNHHSNCTACCRKCNAQKSDKVDARMYKGFIFKFFESKLSFLNRGVGAVGAVGVGLTAAAASKVTRTGLRAGKTVTGFGLRSIFRLTSGLVKGGVKVATFPLRKGSVLSRLVFLVIYTLGILYYLTTYTSVLNAWL